MKKFDNSSSSCKRRRVKNLLLRVKIITLLFFAGTLLISANTYSQKTKINLSVQNASIADVLRSIEQNSRFIFIYNSDVLNSNVKRSISVRSASITSIMNKLFDGSDITYKIDDRQVFLYRKDTYKAPRVLKEIPREQRQVSKNIHGTITNSTGVPLPGVSVTIKGTRDGIITDANGDFKLHNIPPNVTLVISFIGMRSQEIKVGSQESFNIILQDEAVGMNEVVVIGYTTQRKATITGSISTITTKDLEQSPTANLTNALAGRMPGLLATQYSGGEPGVDASNILVRGHGTYGDNSPIVVVDGVERSMDYLDPEEIETFTILKDASATAPYGVRGANGVIIITTKRGKSMGGKAVVHFKASTGINEPSKFPKYLGSADYATLYNEALINDNPGIPSSSLNLFSQDAISKFRKAKGDNSDGLGYNWDYFDYAFKPGVQKDYSLSISGGSDQARYYVMANYFEQGGNYTNTNLSQYDTQAIFKRYNFRSNIDIDITKDFYARLDIGAQITDRNAPGTTAERVMQFCNTQPPYLPIVVEKNDNSTNVPYAVKNTSGMLFGDQIYRFNILGELSRSGFLDEKNSYLDGSFALGYKLDFITKGLKAEGAFSYDASNGRWINRVVNTYNEGYREYPGYATFTPSDGRDVYMTPGHYAGAYTTGNKYDIDQTIGNGYSQNSNVERSYTQFKVEYARKFGDHDVSAMILANRSRKNIDNQVPFCYEGLTGRATYNYKERYLLEYDFGYNGSENFASGRRFGFFPAASAGWVVSNESFMENTKSWLDNLKLRGSFGLVGSDQIPNSQRFIYLQYFGGGSGYNFGDNDFGSGANGGVAEGNLANPYLTWEKSKKFDVGVDMSLFNNRLTFTGDLFFEHRYDIITDMSGSDKMGYPNIVGKNAPYINAGIVNNRGVDFEIGWHGQIGRDFSYFIKPNLSFTKNRIIYMEEIARENSYREETGKPIGTHFDYMFDHFVKNQAEADKLNVMNNGAGFQPWGKLIPGDVVYKDMNGDGKINDNDLSAAGYPHDPEIQFGIPIGFQYKDFDFSLMFQGATKASVQLQGAAVWDFPSYLGDNIGKVKAMHLNRWTPATAETATYPALHLGADPNNKNANSSLFLYDGSYLRLKTVEIGYSLPKSIVRRVGLQKVRFYAQGLNLLTWDKLKDADVDPEVGEGAGDWYPVQRVYNFGVDVTF